MSLLKENISYSFCNFSDEEHRCRLTSLINQYIADPMGGGSPLTSSGQLRLIDGLANHPASFVLFVLFDQQIVGMATCFINFSTFKAKPFINIHDVIIDNRQRGKGFGRCLLQQIELIAKERQYCKITLEVREDNFAAQNLYTEQGFMDLVPKLNFWTKELL
jgi:ribosomal protein S18 acetylase RimI-like enzyme